MGRIALKIDVDTLRGTREGVPALVSLLRDAGADATFLFSLGPDHTGRAVFRALRPGFLQKVSRTSVLEHYGLRTLLNGTLLPGPDIGQRERSTLQAVGKAGFEVGAHCWDHVRWQDKLLARDDAWALREMQRAADRFEDIFGHRPVVHGAAGWQFTEGAADAERRLGVRYASDTRGNCPFLPVGADGAALGPPQLPTTLPTLDEIIGIDGVTTGNACRRILEYTHGDEQDHVYTLHAEMEGMKLQPVLRSLIAGWQAQRHKLVSLGGYYRSLGNRPLPRHRIRQAEIPGRSGLLAVQGERCTA